MGFHDSPQVHLKFECYKCTSLNYYTGNSTVFVWSAYLSGFSLPILCRHHKTLVFRSSSVSSAKIIQYSHESPSSQRTTFTEYWISLLGLLKHLVSTIPIKPIPIHPDLLHLMNNLQCSPGYVCISISTPHTSTSPKRSFHNWVY